jgi:hypothetical protein
MTGNARLSSPDSTRKPFRPLPDDRHDLIHVTRGLFDPYDIVHLRESQQRLGKDVRGCAPGHVVHDDRAVHLGGHGPEVFD